MNENKQHIKGFEKITKTQWDKDWETIFFPALFDSEKTQFFKERDRAYQELIPPCRSTVGSAGYDFYSPVDVTIEVGKKLLIPTGIHCEIKETEVLLLFPRSSLGIKHGIVLTNTTGVIDHDYFYADNEGHIMGALMNIGDEPFRLKRGERFMQGVLIPYSLAANDFVPDDNNRTGGIGSTGR